MNSYDRKFLAAVREMEGNKAFRREAVLLQAFPLFYRILRKAGIRIRPPLYAGFLTNLAVNGILAGILWGVFMHVFIWREESYPVEAQLLGSLIFAAIYGTTMALLIRSRQRKFGLSKWTDLPHATRPDIHESS